MITLRACETDADYEAWLAVRRAVLPNESAPGLDELKQGIKPDDLHLLAELDGELAGSGLMNRSDTGRAHLAPRVLPDKRGRGVGAAILERIAEHAALHGYTEASSHVADDDNRSIAFARRFGFEETRRDIQQELVVDGVQPRDVAGVDFVSIESRPELLEAVFPLAQEGYADMPVAGLDISLESWLVEEATLPGGSFVALEGEQIVGYAGLMRWGGDPAKAEHGLTVVRRDRRRRRLATALKERQIAWAAANGVRTLVTYTQTGNENMQAVNARLGYVTTEGTIAFGRRLPLP
ncbi:MAG: GNAT family N-acetyltransferase [Gaiellaceae bacterium]|jgi:mycothiol synthase